LLWCLFQMCNVHLLYNFTLHYKFSQKSASSELSVDHLSIGDANNGALVRLLPTLSGVLALGVRLTSVGEEVVAVGPRHRLDIQGHSPCARKAYRQCT